jgi:NitT/TauT family transport system permease protein
VTEKRKRAMAVSRATLLRERFSAAAIWSGITGYAWPAATIVALAVVWEVLVVVLEVNKILLPRPSQILAVMYTERALLLAHMWTTLYEIVVGFLLGIVVGVGAGIAIAHSALLERTLYPLLVASQNIPKIAVGPLLVMWIGMGIASKALLVALICFFPMVVNTATGLTDVPGEMVMLLRSLRASKSQIFWKVRLPNAFSYILSGMKVSITLAVIGAIIGEFIAANRGLGFLILLSSGSFNTPLMMAAIGYLVIIGILLFALMSFLADILAPWRVVESESVVVT